MADQRDDKVNPVAVQRSANFLRQANFLRRFRQGTIIGEHDHIATHIVGAGCDGNHYTEAQGGPGGGQLLPRSEERRVGKEC